MDINAPQVGYYKRRFVKGGAWVAGRIFVEKGELKCTLDGEESCPFEQWTWLSGRKISKAEYDRIMERKGDHKALLSSTNSKIDLSENFIMRED